MHNTTDQDAQIPALIRLLQGSQPPEELMAEIMLEIGQAMAAALSRFGDYSPREIKMLMAPLARDLMNVRHEPELRKVELLGASSVLQVRARGVVEEASSATDCLFGGQPAIAAWELVGGRSRHTSKWQIFSASQWHIMILEWLSNHLGRWLGVVGANRAPGVNAAAIAREVARITARKTPAYGRLLDVLLLDALGYPRPLVAYHLRLGLRSQLPTSLHWEQHLMARWSDTQYWPGRTRKLFPIAVSAAPQVESGILTPANVRDALIASGLSRNAWANLARLPSRTLHLLCQALEDCRTPSLKKIFLEEISLWFSRLGKGFRYYRIPSANLATALIWAVRESVEIRQRQGGDTRPTRVMCVPLLPDSLFWHESLVSRTELSAQNHERLQLVLLAFSREVMSESDEIRSLLDKLAGILDWFRVESMDLPVSWFKKPFSIMHGRSRRWHESVVIEQQERVVAEAEHDDVFPPRELLDMPRSMIATGSWDAMLPRYETKDLVFEALLNSDALRDEGALMRHCVGSYVAACLDGRSLIYAVTCSGQRMGTLEMCRDRMGAWYPAQFKGRQNKQLIQYFLEGGKFYAEFCEFRRHLNRMTVRQERF